MDTHDSNQKVAVVGVGGAGNRVLNSLAHVSDSKYYSLVALDTDNDSLHVSDAETRIEAGFKWTDGIGCGGDPFKGQRAVATARPKISAAVKNSGLVVITGGLGGGTATQAAGIVAGCAKEANIPVVAIMTMPFGLEGQSRRQIAESGYNDLLNVADVVFCLPNDLLFCAMKPETPVKDAYLIADEEVARSVVGVIEMLKSKKLLAGGFADFKQVLNRKNATCCIGVGRSYEDDEVDHRCHLAVSRLESSPLLGGKEFLARADVLFISLIGGEDLSIAEAKKTTQVLARFAGKKTKVIVGINTGRTYDATVQVSAIAVRYGHEGHEADSEDIPDLLFEEETPDPASKKQSYVANDTDGQMMFTFQTESRGIFSGGDQFVYKGEDYDVPTFQRRNEVIDTGV